MRTPLPRLRHLLPATFLAAAAGLAGAAPAVPPPAQTAPARPPEQAATEARIADELRRIALIDVRLPATPGAAHYRLTGAALDLAQRFAPEDAEIARQRAAAAFAAGDETALERATADVVRLDPADTVAQLRLISGRVTKLQTVDERLAFYDRFLGPGGERLDPSVRSRLALDAALLHAERGETEAFARRLTDALRFDGSNKEAATLALSFFTSNVDQPAAALELMLNLLHSDPVDARLHAEVAAVLHRYGVPEPAYRFLQNAANLCAAENCLPPSMQLRLLLLRWQVEGPQTVVDELVGRIAVQLRRAMETGRGSDELLLSTDEIVTAILAAADSGDQQTLSSAVELVGQQIELLRTIVKTRREAVDAELIPSQRDLLREGLQAAETRLQQAIAARAEAVAIIGAALDTAVAEADAAAQAVGGEWGRHISLLVRAWAGWHKRDAAPVAAFLQQGDPSFRSAPLLHALTTPLPEGATREQVLAALSRQLAGSPYAAYAAALIPDDRAHVLRTSEGETMRSIAEAVPAWVHRAAADPGEFMRVALEPIDGDPRRPQLRITLENRAPIPLAVGSGRPINSRFLLSTRIGPTNIEEQLGLAVQPEVVELDRRLRLAPRESVQMIVDAAPGITGLAIDAASGSHVTTRFHLDQAFTLGALGVSRGPMASSAETPIGEIALEPATRLSPAELGRAIAAAEQPLHPLLVAARAHLLAKARVAPADAERIADGAVRRLREGTPEEAILIALMLPHESLVPGMSALDDALLRAAAEDAAGGDPSPLVEVVLLTRVASPDHPLIAAAENAGIPFASLLRARLREGTVGYASAGPGLQALASEHALNRQMRRRAADAERSR